MVNVAMVKALTCGSIRLISYGPAKLGLTPLKRHPRSAEQLRRRKQAQRRRGSQAAAARQATKIKGSYDSMYPLHSLFQSVPCRYGFGQSRIPKDGSLITPLPASIDWRSWPHLGAKSHVDQDHCGRPARESTLGSSQRSPFRH